MKDNCIFCKIINGEIPCHKIYENEKTIAFLDINPDSYGHSLIIPKKHFKNYQDIDLETIKSINETGKLIFNKIAKNISPDGIRLVQNNGIIQDVPHYHLHIIPVYKEDKENKTDFENILKTINL